MSSKKIRKIMCANRGEIAIRVFRAATELGIQTVAIFSHEDRVNLHRYKADQAFLVGKDRSPVAAYLNIEEIISIARENQVDAIHPGYGFLSERPAFARACEEAQITFIGPSADVLAQLGDKTTARTLATSLQLPVVPGTPDAVASLEEGLKFVDEIGLPIIIKAAHGGGGRGMRVVHSRSEFSDAFVRAKSEALAAFGDGTVFIERFIEKPRHIEVQILGDLSGEVIHLFERDCSVQRRHQKVVEVAPAVNLDPSLRTAITQDAVKLAQAVRYRNAGTVEFLVDNQGRHYFIEVNPRIQVEHTVTEEVTGIDLVQSQIQIAAGKTLEQLDLLQSSIQIVGNAIQCRVTTEDPENGFQPDTGRIEAYRSASGMGIRLDGGAGYAGAQISPHYDSLLVKVTGHALGFESAAHKVSRALAEFRVRGVKTNIPFLQKVLNHPVFVAGQARTDFIDSSTELFQFPHRRNRAQRILRFLGEVAVNGPTVPVKPGSSPSSLDPEIPSFSAKNTAPEGWRRVLLEQGPAAFAKAIRGHKGLLLTDTTWRDAHQSLLATRVRTIDLAAVAPATAHALPQLFSLEMWGGATFDVALRFLRECPWERLELLRQLVPNIPFQMLLRGANAVGYTNYPDNVVQRFVRQARQSGIDVFRIFDCLNYVENMKLGVDAVGQTDGVIEAAICYTGDVSDTSRTKYSLQYYIDIAGQYIDLGIHVLAIKDMAGLLKPEAARQLVSTLRKAFPYVPIHVHTHDTSGTGVASMLACAHAGGDIVDVALSAMAGTTSQPALSAIVAGLAGTERDTQISIEQTYGINSYWEQARGLYAGFESGLKSGSSDIYEHEMPGGQYSNLQFQAESLGLAGRWRAIKKAYASANRLLGDIIKVTPSSKVVGDFAQFMVQNDLDETEVIEQGESLSFPQSLVEYFQGYLGEPYGGYPEPLRSYVLRGRPSIQGRPGASLEDFDFDSLERELKQKWGNHFRNVDVISAALYPKVFDEYMGFRSRYSNVAVLPTRYFVAPMNVGDEIGIAIEHGKTLIVRLMAVGELHKGLREVFFELNGQPRSIHVADSSAHAEIATRERADTSELGSVGAPMPGVVVEIKASVNTVVEVGEPLVILSAMKMETPAVAPMSGKVRRLVVKVGDSLKAGDLLLEIESSNSSVSIEAKNN